MQSETACKLFAEPFNGVHTRYTVRDLAPGMTRTTSSYRYNIPHYGVPEWKSAPVATQYTEPHCYRLIPLKNPFHRRAIGRERSNSLGIRGDPSHFQPAGEGSSAELWVELCAHYPIKRYIVRSLTH
jgi:hypothetical protein